ncbi:erythromycin esterase family protein [Streptomyces sp. SAI-229]|uniref:erythromycin esterase family protein n=1 Tax=Streptomyces sp. SAI-229 TaxID=3377731 RepID=UPI003C7C2098
MTSFITRRLAAALLAWLAVAPGTAVAAAPAGGDPGASDGPFTAAGDVRSPLEEAARPLRTVEPSGPFDDLRPFGRAVGDAVVVGIGEAAHGSHDFVAFRHRVLRYLVEEKGFRSFVLEANWSAGLRLDDYLITGRGDPARIMAEEFRNAYLLLHSQEYLDMVRWMRAYNVAHPDDPVRFAGNDNGYAGPELYDRVVDHVRRAHPDLLPTVTELYRGLRPALPVDAWMRAAVTAPLDERRARAERTGRVLELLRAREPAGADGADEDHAWALQHATVIDQVARLYAFDLSDPRNGPEAMAHRDTAMAENTLWWHRHTGHRLVLGGHDSHLYTRSSTPTLPLPQGSVLRRRLGDGYLAVGLSFDRGAVHATAQGLQNPADQDVGRFEVEPAAPGSAEHVLDRVSHRNWYADLRTAPPAARALLDVTRPKREIGTDYPPTGDQVNLLRSMDLVVHLDEIRPSRLLLPH